MTSILVYELNNNIEQIDFIGEELLVEESELLFWEKFHRIPSKYELIDFIEHMVSS